MTTLRVVGLASLMTVSATLALAQAPAPPARPVPAEAPAVLPPPAAAVAPARAPGGAPAAVSTTPTAAPVRAAAPASSLPVDSVRPSAAVPATTPPVNAVAQCVDGLFVTDAAACASRRGLLVMLPAARTARPPAPPRSVAAPAPVAVRAAAPASTPAPAGATMRCRDGTYLMGAPDAGRCAGNGGLAAILVLPSPEPARPPQPRVP